MFATIAGPYPPIGGPPKDALEATLADQLEAGLGMVTDGRVRALATDDDVDGAVEAWRRASALVAELTAGAGTDAPTVKACLVGPLSMDGSLDAAAARVRAAILALHAAGVAVVQVEEPWSAAADAATDEGRARAREAWTVLLDGVTGHVTLGLPGGGATNVGADAMSAAPFGSHLVDLIHGPDDWREVGRLPGERGVVLGVADLRPGRRDTKEVLIWASRHAAAMHGRGLARVGLTTSAGLEALPRETARDRLRQLAQIAALGSLSGAELAGRLDPCAIDARSAALGRWEPRPRLRPGPRRGFLED